MKKIILLHSIVRRKITCILCIGCFSFTALAQKQISGTVIDTAGEAVIGASISEKGTSNGTVTDRDGKFALKAGDNAVLLVSFIGYVTQEVVVNNRTTLRILLAEDTQ